MKRCLFVLAVLLLLNACALIGLGRQGIGKIPLSELEPTVEFVEEKEVEVPQSDIGSVDADQVISSYLRLMESPHGEVRRQAMRRLADLNMRLAEEKNAELAEGKTLESLPKAMRDSSYARAAELYQQVISDFPKQADDATIRYQLARALALDGRSDESLVELDNLADQHEQADELVEVQFRRGEAYFLRREYREAADAYKNVLSMGKDTEFYDKALYKNGWSRFKLFDYEGALENFFPLLERLKEGADVNEDVKMVTQELIKDTSRAISLSFYQLEGPTSVSRYFAEKGRTEYEHEIYDDLAALYLKQERFQDAAKTYDAFVQQNPLHPKAAFFQLNVIKTYVEGGFPSLVLPAKESFLKQFGVKSEYWTQADDNLKATLKPNVITNLEEVSSHYHAKAQREKSKSSYLVAADWYSHFLELSQDEKDVAPYHFLMAEAFYDAKEYQRAIKEFDIIAYQYQTYAKREQAAYNILLAYQALEQQTDPKNVAAINQYKEQTINYTLLYAEYFPESQRSAELLLRASEQLLTFNRVDESIQASEKLLALPGVKKKELTDRAKVIIANGLFDQKKYKEAEQALSRVLVEVTLKPKDRQEFQERRAESIFKQAEAFQEAKQIDLAIAEYQRLISVEPNSSIRPKAEIEAAVLLMQQEKWQEAKNALEGFRGRFSQHPLAEGLDERLAFVYEKLSLWSDAASAYQRIASKTKDPNKAREIQWYVADLYLKAGNSSAAIVAFKTYYDKHKEPFVQSMEAQAKLVELYQKAGNDSQVTFWRNKIVSSYRTAGAKNTDRTRYLAAQSAFELAEPMYEQFKQIKLTLPLNKSLPRKRAMMDKALKAYGDIGKFKVAEFTTASTHRVGELYLNLAKDIINSERPPGMSELELEEYQYLIEDQAFPIEEKAIEIFSSNSGRAAQSIYDEWVKKSFEALSGLQPARYNKQELIESWFGGS
ncbi:tetratricopeptide repeat protein [Pleionea sediminis]|uniref:tetratricopeptide repeat protein n=1 Tax=Pleionea sediminis TaxID=2569479 RepID=UPI001186115F|nr:tetratricopeptide repeat protein [Pleionea sediminis]